MAAATFIAVLGPVVLSLMGIAINFKRSLRNLIWMIAFLVVGGGTVVATLIEQNQAHKKSLGSDQFPIVQAITGTDPKGQFDLVAFNPTALPLRDLTILVFPRDGSPIDGRTLTLNILYPYQLVRLNLSLPLGDYAIDIRTRAVQNGFFERLTLTATENGQVRQNYYVRRVGSDKKLMDVH